MNKYIYLSVSVIVLLGILLYLYLGNQNQAHPIDLDSHFEKNITILSGGTITSYSSINHSKYLVVFEAGLGDDHSVWNNIANQIQTSTDILLYDRGGYGESIIINNQRDIVQLRLEFEALIKSKYSHRKIILIGHSWGGMIIRDFAIKNPEKIGGMLFLDPSHEDMDFAYPENTKKAYTMLSEAFGKNSSIALECEKITESENYIKKQGTLPNIPVIVITNTSVDWAGKDTNLWYKVHESLGFGITNFTHITTSGGHYIMNSDPEIVISNIRKLLNQ